MFLYPLYFSDIWIYILAAVLPALILLCYIYKKDHVEKEPVGLLLQLLVAGLLAALVSIVLERILQSILDAAISPFDPAYSIIMAFLVVAAVEEGTKYSFLKRASWKNRNFNYRFDGIVYAVFVSLGFAAFENVLYVFNYGLSVALPRALLAVPGHMGFSVFMGLFYGRAKLYENNGYRGRRWFNQIIAYISAVFLHGFYDACLMIGTDQSTMMFAGFVAIMYVLVFLLIRYESKHDKYI